MAAPGKSDTRSDLAAKVAWLYYVANHTQQEIAETLRVSRPTVQRLVASAVESGIVQVRISHPTRDCMEAAEEMRRRFGLSLCEIAPVEDEHDGKSLHHIAIIGAAVLEHILSQPGLQALALGSGRTLKAVIDEIAEVQLPRLTILSVVGAVALDGSFNRYNCGFRMADKTNGKHFFLPMPLIGASIADTEIWRNNRLYHLVDDAYATAEAALIGIAEIGPGSPLIEDGFVTDAEIEELMRKGAVAELLGWPLDAQGQHISAPLAERVTSMPLERLSTRPVIAFAAGRRKAAAILAALRGRWISGLVTDIETARLVLDQA